MQQQLTATVGGTGLVTKITPGWHTDPSAGYVGIDVIPPGLNRLRASVCQQRDSQLYFQIVWGTTREDYEALCEGTAMRTLLARLNRKYGDEWYAPDEYHLGYMYRDVYLRNDDIARRLARSSDDVVSEIARDFSSFLDCILPHLKKIRLPQNDAVTASADG